MNLRLLLATIWVFKEMVVFLTLKQKGVLLVASLFELKVDFGVFDTKNKNKKIRARVLVVSIESSSCFKMC